jgi:hypothetical protein
MTPASPCIGSIITAIVSLSMATLIASILLNATFLNPGTFGSNQGSNTALPNADIVARVLPWKVPTVVIMCLAPGLLYCAYFLANLIAPSLASAPLLAKNTGSVSQDAVNSRARSISGWLK